MICMHEHHMNIHPTGSLLCNDDVSDDYYDYADAAVFFLWNITYETKLSFNMSMITMTMLNIIIIIIIIILFLTSVVVPEGRIY